MRGILHRRIPENIPVEAKSAFLSNQNCVLMPGIVDAHSHLELQAMIYSGHFVAQILWPRIGGCFFPVWPTRQDELDRIKGPDRQLPPAELLYAAGYDENRAGGLLIGSQLRLARKLGMMVQFFILQIYYYGDAALRLRGPDRAHHAPHWHGPAPGRQGTAGPTTRVRCWARSTGFR